MTKKEKRGVEEIEQLMKSIVKVKEEKILLDIGVKKRRNTLDYLSQPVSFLAREEIKDEDVNLEKFVKIRNDVSKVIEEMRTRNQAYLVRTGKEVKKIVESRKSKKIKIENLRLRKDLEVLNEFMRQIRLDLKHDVEDIEVYHAFLCSQNSRFERLKEKHTILDFYIESLKNGYKDESLLLSDKQTELKDVFFSTLGNPKKRDFVYKSKITKLNQELIQKVTPLTPKSINFNQKIEKKL